MPFQIESEHFGGVVKVLVPKIFEDERGFFMEVYRSDRFEEVGISEPFVQINQSRSVKGVVRGLHFQWDPPMSKLMRVINGKALLVAVDLRKGSPTLGQWVSVVASAENRKQLWAPASFARGFCVLSDFAEIEYCCTGIYNPNGETSIRWDERAIGIDWPVENPIISERDRRAQSLAEWLARPESDSFRY